jgi:ABC-type proline/glycine betaine transport system permease subunit
VLIIVGACLLVVIIGIVVGIVFFYIKYKKSQTVKQSAEVIETEQIAIEV